MASILASNVAILVQQRRHSRLEMAYLFFYDNALPFAPCW